MEMIRSADGTQLAVESTGRGPALVFAVGALCDRAAFADLADLLAPDHTVHRYDRRGRGDSGDIGTYTPEAEYADLAAVIAHAGGDAAVFGHSSGAALALQAAAHGVDVRAIVAYEPPYGTDPDPAGHHAFLAELRTHDGRPADAVRFWFASTGMGDMLAELEAGPEFPRMVRAAPTLTYDVELLGPAFPALGTITAPTLVLGGAASPPFLLDAVAAVTAAVPGAEQRLLPGQTHEVDAAVLAPLLHEHLAGLPAVAEAP